LRIIVRSLSLLLFSAALPLFAQDLTIVSTTTHDGKSPQTTTSYISSDHVRMAQGEGRQSIVDFKTGAMTTIDDRKKTYYVTTRQDLDAFAAKMQEQMNSPEMKKAQAAMKNQSPEDQKKMDDAMGSMFAFNVQKTGTTRKIAGYTCDNWVVTIGQFSRSEECVTSSLQLPVQAWEMYRHFSDSMKSAMAAFGPMAKNAGKMQEEFKKMKGFPLANTTTVDVMGHKSVIATEVTEVRRGPIPASAWEVPAGYTKIDNPMLRAFQRRGR
jgi:hypothetical protein